MAYGTLYIVATPIGNLEDMTFRAVRILKEVDLVAAEDTRHSRKLLTHFGISRPLTSYYDHNQNFKGNYLLERLQAGDSVALISDAGTPCISDPGYQLVRDAVAAGITVVPVPGPSAAITALSAAGLPTDAFVFAGFLPNRAGKRREKLSSLTGEQRVIVFYESPNRLLATLADMLELFGVREVVVARELTKIYEEFVRGPLPDVLAGLEGRQIKGEVVILVAPSDAPEAPSVEDVPKLLQHCLEEGLSLKDAVKQVALETGHSRSAVYEEALRLKGAG
ncbi:MAG: 16S rRNA (cytidine(1402)-2'-O)-methyltransferase [Geobacter sp.]|nr:MAG: 16S rRNA (cytidine(1402)-2'-O)-methyltransferase [Geobacter sp.]